MLLITFIFTRWMFLLIFFNDPFKIIIQKEIIAIKGKDQRDMFSRIFYIPHIHIK